MDTNTRSVAQTMWWLVLVRGILMVLFGILALVWPGIALLTLVWLFGVYAILDGVTAVVIGVRSRGEPHRVWTVVQGVVSVLAGLVALAWPGVTALALLFVIAFWAIIMGIGEIGGAFASRRSGSGAWGWTLAAGILNVVFGVLLLIWPAGGLLALVWLVGIFALAGGSARVVRAVRVRSAAGAGDRTLESH
ncbi:HdeD family acid-resistance protein [Pseudonocardia sp. DLS-67]